MPDTCNDYAGVDLLQKITSGGICYESKFCDMTMLQTRIQQTTTSITDPTDTTEHIVSSNKSVRNAENAENEDEEKDEKLKKDEIEKDEKEFVYLQDYYRNFKNRHTLHPSVRELFTRIGVRQRTASWFKIRRGKITASQVCAVINSPEFKENQIYRFKSAFKSCKQLIRSKLGEFKQIDNHILRYGRDNEKNAVACAVRKGLPILHERAADGSIDAVDFGLLQHPEHSFLAGSPDGVTSNGYVVEIKCPWSEKKKKNIKSGYVPDCYYLQMQILMEIMDLRGAYFVQYAPSTIMQDETLAVTVVPRSKELFNETLLPILRTFFTQLMCQMKINTSTTIVDARQDPIEVEKSRIRREAAEKRVRAREEAERVRLKFHYGYIEGTNMLLKSQSKRRKEIISYKLIESGYDTLITTTASANESDEENFGML